MGLDAGAREIDLRLEVMQQQIEAHREVESETDVRVQATSKIWTFAVAAMVFVVPLTAITGSSLIALMAVLSPAIATAAVWFSGDKNRSTAPISRAEGKASRADRERIAELEERLANLEAIDNFERRLAQESLQRHNDALNAPVESRVTARANGESGLAA